MNSMNVCESTHLGLCLSRIVWLDWLEGYEDESWDVLGDVIFWPEDLGERPEWLDSEVVELRDEWDELAGEDCFGEARAAYTAALGEPGRWACNRN
jgi:hypothetical protein